MYTLERFLGARSFQELMEAAEHPENIEAVINTKSAEISFLKKV